MNKSQVNSSKVRIEKSIQFSGKIPYGKIKTLKSSCYYVIDVPLDGDAPKQYVKVYFYFEKCPKKKSVLKWPGYYAKFGGKSYPHESITEYGINKIGEALGLKMNETELVMINNQVRFLSKDFIDRGKKKLIHGVEILHEYFEDKEFIDEINQDRKQRRALLTFDVIENALKHVHPIQFDELMEELIRLITFDAIVGNNDRHFYNWGVIGDVKRKYNLRVEFAPIYDTARGLLWNKTEQKIKKMYSQYMNGSTDEIEAFVKRSKPRFSFDENTNANHFDLIEFLANRNPAYRKIIHSLISPKNEIKLFVQLNESIFRLFSQERKFLIAEILKLRFKILRTKT